MVVAVALIHRVHPDWLAVGVTEAARAEGFNPERISRLCSRILGPWQTALDGLCRRGRPAHQATQDDQVTLLQALLTVATTVLGQVNLSRPALRDLLVGAWLRLKIEVPQLTQDRFCQALALPSRTLRSWLSASPPRPGSTGVGSAPVLPSTRPRKPRPPRLRRPRFRFDLVIPGTQIGADTTDLSVLGVPLKLVAAQDIGGRDQDLFSSVVVDDHESSKHVIDVLTAAIASRKGFQAITDQGTPYMANATRDALDQLGAEHAPQREGDPQGKSTVERGFGILKAIAAPLLALSDRVAKIVPALCDPELAKNLGHLIVAVLLRSYQAGGRAARAAAAQRSGLDEEALVRAAARAREDAQAVENSKRLLLAHWHKLYHFDVSVSDFIRQFRGYPLPALKQAEAKLRSQLHRNDIHSLSRYFGAIVRDASDQYRADRACRQRTDRDCAESTARAEQNAAIRRARSTDPVRWLHEGLIGLIGQWLPVEQQLLCGGEGAALGWLRGALRRVLVLHGHAAITDIALGVLNDCVRIHHDRLGEQGAVVIRSLLRRELAALFRSAPNSCCGPHPSPATLWNTGRTRRPPAPIPLPI